jgi:hypothetical protein
MTALHIGTTAAGTAFTLPLEAQTVTQSVTGDYIPHCMFCGLPLRGAVYGPESPECPDARSSWGHVDFWASTPEQRDARFGPVAVKPAALARAVEVARAPQMGLGL